MTAPSKLDGRNFRFAALDVGVREEDRLAVATFAGGAQELGVDLLEYSFDPGAVDLTLVRLGRAPLLAEHVRSLDCLLGNVVEVEAAGAALTAYVRFATGAEPDRLYGLLCDGFALSLSIGAGIEHAERIEDLPRGGGRYRVTRWTLKELSVVIYGADPTAELRLLGRDQTPTDLATRVAPAPGDGARAGLRRALHLDGWDRWAAAAAAPRLAARFGLDEGEFAAALGGEVAAHCSALEARLAL